MNGMDEALEILREMEETIARISGSPSRGTASEARPRLHLIKKQDHPEQPSRISPPAPKR